MSMLDQLPLTWSFITILLLNCVRVWLSDVAISQTLMTKTFDEVSLVGGHSFLVVKGKAIHQIKCLCYFSYNHLSGFIFFVKTW